MNTPNNQAGTLTELMMFSIKERLSQRGEKLNVAQYNAIYETIYAYFDQPQAMRGM